MNTDSGIIEIGRAANLKVNGHYSFATLAGDTAYVSGCFSVDPNTGEKKIGTVYEETLQALANLECIGKTFGADRRCIVKTTAYVCSMEDWPEVNRAYAAFFGDYRPARTIVNAKELHFGFKVEIEGILVTKTPKAF